PTLVVHVPTSVRSSAEVRVDGESLPRDRWDAPVPVDPGTHAVELLAPPNPPETRTVSVAKGEHTSVLLTLPTSAATDASPHSSAPRRGERSSSQRTLGLVAGGVGLAGLTVGAIFGVMSISAHSSVVGRCPTYPTCASSDRAALDDSNDRARSTGTISTV